jgi:hypothetical protein
MRPSIDSTKYELPGMILVIRRGHSQLGDHLLNFRITEPIGPDSFLNEVVDFKLGLLL